MTTQQAAARSAKRIDTLAGEFFSNKATMSRAGRSGKTAVVNKQWSRILKKAAHRLRSGDFLEQRVVSARRLLKLARRFGSAKAKGGSRKPASVVKILTIAAQRLLEPRA